MDATHTLRRVCREITALSLLCAVATFCLLHPKTNDILPVLLASIVTGVVVAIIVWSLYRYLRFLLNR